VAILVVVVGFAASRLTVMHELVGNPTAVTAAEIETALSNYREEHGHYPPLEFNLDELAVGRDGTPLERPYLSGRPRDAWGRPFRYELFEGKPRVYSGGPDGKFGTPDDIHAKVLECKTRYVFR
jgi:hypothetical protein